MHLEDGLRRFADELGNEVHLTEERLRHLLRRHPEMAFQMHRFGKTLMQPDAIRASKSNPSVQIYYRLYSDLRGRNRYLCLEVKKDGKDTKILTGYLSRRIEGE